MSPYELQVNMERALSYFYSARRTARMILGSSLRNLPFLLGLPWKERQLRLQLPRLAVLSLLPQRRRDVLAILERALKRESWQRLQSMVMVPAIRLYGWRHIRQWAKQARSRDYVAFLRQLSAVGRAQLQSSAQLIKTKPSPPLSA
jgi:hypothetical protein